MRLVYVPRYDIDGIFPSCCHLCVLFVSLYLLSFAWFSFQPLFFCLHWFVLIVWAKHTNAYVTNSIACTGNAWSMLRLAQVVRWVSPGGFSNGAWFITFIKRLQQLLQQPSSQNISSLQIAIYSLSRIAISRSSSFNVRAKRVRTGFRTLTWLYLLREFAKIRPAK